jgi:hypothetical protein
VYAALSYYDMQRLERAKIICPTLDPAKIAKVFFILSLSLALSLARARARSLSLSLYIYVMYIGLSFDLSSLDSLPPPSLLRLSYTPLSLLLSLAPDPLPFPFKGADILVMKKK